MPHRRRQQHEYQPLARQGRGKRWGRRSSSEKALAAWSDFRDAFNEELKLLEKNVSYDEMVRRLEGGTHAFGKSYLQATLSRTATTEPAWPPLEAALVAHKASEDNRRGWKIRWDAVRASLQPQPAPVEGLWRTRPPNRTIIWNPLSPGRRVDLRGRASDIDQILHHLRTTTTPLAVHGLPGLGKSRLAVQAAETAAESFDVAWWADARTPASFTRSLLDLARALDPAVDLNTQATVRTAAGDDTNAQLPYVTGVTELLGDRRWLLILDSASPLVATQVLPHLDTGRAGRIVLTTNRWSARDGVEVLHLKPLSDEAAKAILDLPDTDSTRMLISRMHGLPLVVHQVAALLAKQTMTVDELLSTYTVDALGPLGLKGPRDHSEPTIDAWNASFDDLAATSATTAGLFESLCWWDPGVPVNLSTLLASQASGHVHGKTSTTDDEATRSRYAADRWPTNLQALDQAQTDLLDLALIEPAEDGFILHELVAQARRARSNRDRTAPTAVDSSIRHLANELR